MDALWDTLSAKGQEAVVVDSKILHAAGYHPSDFVRAPPEWNVGDDAYPVQIDVFHQIHCLNMIRKQIYAKHYLSPEIQVANSTSRHWHHLNHCMSMLLQNLVCHSDDNIIPHKWVEALPHPSADFSVRKQCKNFDHLQRWNEKNALVNIREKWASIQPSEDAVIHKGYGENGFVS